MCIDASLDIPRFEVIRERETGADFNGISSRASAWPRGQTSMV